MTKLLLNFSFSHKLLIDNSIKH